MRRSNNILGFSWLMKNLGFKDISKLESVLATCLDDVG